MKKFLIIAISLLALTSCGGGGAAHKKAAGTAETASPAQFPYPTVPSMVTTQKDAYEYAVLHFWNEFYSNPTKYYNKKEMEKAFANYCTMLMDVPIPVAREAQEKMLAKAAAAHNAHPELGILEETLELNDRYLYDVNSPYRNEEYYLPVMEFVLSRSDMTPETVGDMKREYPLFCLNRPGTVAADFSYTLRNGRTGTLHSIKADIILLFFSNPGCENCKEIIDALSNSQNVHNLIETGVLKVVNIYPDQDLSEWFKYMSHYPKEWINGFDPDNIIRSDTKYYMRAIPSLYLLDAEKRVICKDAPLEIVMKYLNSYGK